LSGRVSIKRKRHNLQQAHFITGRIEKGARRASEESPGIFSEVPPAPGGAEILTALMKKVS
jgi:hypothetical protein